MRAAGKADVRAAPGVTAGPSAVALSSPCSLTLDFGETYEGAVQTKNGIALPHGQGVWRSADGALRYEGHFVQRWRDGYGRLCTPAFTLWARWRMDRPDLSSSIRLDYANGDRYCGFIEWKTKSEKSSRPRSRFAVWATSVQPTRQRWGELVMQSGDAYVGEWRDDEREGFGCYVWPSGSRYTGRFHRGQFSDVGTLFIAAAEVDGCFTRLSGGGWRCGQAGKANGAERSARAARWPPLTRPSWDGVIVDVVWADGRCRGEGHVTLPGGTRISADWRTASSPVDGELVLPALAPQARVDPDAYEWHESFQWESLFSGATDGDAGHRAMAEKVLSTRVNIQQSNSAEVVKSCLVELLNTHELAKTTLHVFRRCFYGLYGTCGVETGIGAGGGGTSGLGWCSLRNQYGGCVHLSSPGRPIQAADLDLALRDIASLARSTVRWVLELMGPELPTKVLDCGGEAVVGRWVADRVFHHCYPVLLNLYRQVYRSEEAALAASIARMRDAVSLDDMGVLFARQSASQAKLFDPYTDAVHCVEQLNGETQTLTTMLKVLVQWSREIDLSTRLTQASPEPLLAGAERRTSQPKTSLAGSADDLLPIHQYVLSQSRCPHLYAVAKLLSDFASESLFMEATSQEAFGVTTLQVCVLTLLRLHPWERDDANILVPFSVTTDRVGAVAQRWAKVAEWTRAALDTSVSASEVAQMEAFMVQYAKLWVPRAVGWAGEHISDAASSFLVSDCDFSAEELALLRLRPVLCGEAVCLGCWLYASSLLGALHLRLHLDALELPQRLQSASDVTQACGRLRGYLQNDQAALQLRVGAEPSVHLIPSRLLRMEVHLCGVLSSLL
ncbi:hypothetical protein ABB37_05519 [Leptomonas pyrrhocoris]|uniref:VPS9 domain-containing protein n=1 Tax=Leptomonas pyrrhocoris TaxID=157538 RepID=A0A0M9G0J5_LEPPY|nr:hypothetical protein ABB37_05519 [Leptomonas pyrrhocoris]KPA79773.1 hypothetical protein ABB37_05519 [Leptomonas pyrrhocoris]|eukprot:XP_015658212.1 hypothetical protein ABB37_05519 [Leptomonas pyrrhocoris]